MKIYLDMDGTISDFVLGIHRACKIKFSYAKYPYEPGNYYVLADLYEKVDKIMLTEIINSTSFWANLPVMKDGMNIYNKIKNHDVYILTATGDFMCEIGKKIWVKNNLGLDEDRIIFEKDKFKYATADTLLIDDYDKNVDQFIEAGGRAILVPRPWNKRWREWIS